MITKEQRRLVREMVKLLKEKFPDLTYEGIADWGDGRVRVKMRGTSERLWEAGDFIADWETKTLRKYGYLVTMKPVPDDEAPQDGGSERRTRVRSKVGGTRRQTNRKGVKSRRGKAD